MGSEVKRDQSSLCSLPDGHVFKHSYHTFPNALRATHSESCGCLVQSRSLLSKQALSFLSAAPDYQRGLVFVSTIGFIPLTLEAIGGFPEMLLPFVPPADGSACTLTRSRRGRTWSCWGLPRRF